MPLQEEHSSLIKRSRDSCEICKEYSSLGRLSSYERLGNLDIQKYHKIYTGADYERSLNEALKEHMKDYYPDVNTRAYSLPEGYILRNRDFKELKEEAKKSGEDDVDLPANYLAVARVFDEVKYAWKDVPSLTIADYAFTDTLFKVGDAMQRKKFIEAYGVSSENMKSGDHDVFGFGLSGRHIVGLFFQVKGTKPDANKKTVWKDFKIATKQVHKDIDVFRRICCKFITADVKLAGFPAFPMFSKSDLEKAIECEGCRARILISDPYDAKYFTTFLKRHGIELKPWDKDPNSPIMNIYKSIFELYVCAASAVKMPRNLIQLFKKSDEQMKEMLMILTPHQRKLVTSIDKVIYLCGTSGTGKTFVLKKRADTKEGKVLMINMAGGLLTSEFQHHFEENEEVEVIDGRKEGLEENLQRLKKFLQENGKGKHVLIDEVSFTLGFQDVITTEALSNHWEWVADMEDQVESITVSFRPNDQSYTRDFSLQDVKPGGFQVEILERVKRNTRKVAELFLAIGDYSRRIFTSFEKTHRMDLEESKSGFLPKLFLIPSCFSLHPDRCRDEILCEAVRTFHAIHAIYDECSPSSPKMPLYVVVDDAKRRNVFVNAVASLDPSFPVIFHHRNGEFRRKRPPALQRLKELFFGKRTRKNVPLVVVTEEEMIGCHPKNVTVVLDLPRSKWINYSRLIATTGENKFLVIEKEEERTGKFSRITEEIRGWDIKESKISVADLNRTLEKFRKKYKSQDIVNLEEDVCPIVSFPGMEMDWDEGEGEDEDEKEMLEFRLRGMFGPPASGKSRKIDLLMRQLLERGYQVHLLHPGSALSREVYRQRWKHKPNMYIEDIDASKIKSLLPIMEHVQNAGKAARMKKEEQEGKDEADSLIVVVEDCPLLNELQRIKERLKQLRERKMKVILAFKPHSEDGQLDDIKRAVEVFKDSPDSTAIVLSSQPTNVDLLRHIQRNEAGIALKLEARSLAVSSLPAAIVPGQPVRFFKCSGRHLGYICRGEGTCHKSVAVASAIMTDHQSYILASDKDLLKSLQVLLNRLEIQVIHPENFRGCEASVIVSLDVNDDWLLEVISRSRTQLIIIDNIPGHEDLWRTMTEEQLVQTWDGPSPEDIAANPGILFSLDEKENFLNVGEYCVLPDLVEKCAFYVFQEPTWNGTGGRIGEEAVGLLDQHTGAIQNLSKMWEALNKTLPLPSSSSPFAEWGYAWDGNPGEAPEIGDERRREIIELLERKGVKWEPKHSPPVALDIRGIGGGLLESLTLTLTGSLLHLPLLKKRMEKNDERSSPELNAAEPMPNGVQSNPSDALLHQIQLAANIIMRPIILIGEVLSRTFFPQVVGDGEKDWRGILLFVQENPQLTIIPIVPHRMSGDVWMEMEELPKAHGEDQPHSSRKRIPFRGKVKVTWKRHTATIL
ncbi:unnamed protein product, partial [Darwinula stevensoni]